MGRLIYADAFSAFLKDAVIKHKYDRLNIDNTLTVADVLQSVCAELDGTGIEGFKNAPTVDAVPVVHGHWIKFGVSDKDGNHQYRCSVCECEEIHSPLVKVSYCWNCGARMDGKGGEQT
jgi:hypothetical protein